MSRSSQISALTDKKSTQISYEQLGSEPSLKNYDFLGFTKILEDGYKFG